MNDQINIPAQPLMARWMASFLSVIVHPLFVPVYITLFLLFIHPLVFTGYTQLAKIKLLTTVFVNLTLFPAVTVFLCRRLGFISSIKMYTQKERLIPLAATMIFYFWGWYVLRSFNEVPVLFKQFLLGSFITIIAGWLANIYFKVSLHGLAMGGLIAFMVYTVYQVEGGSATYLIVTFLLVGLVCSARLILAVHRPFEVYAGLVIGALAQVLAIFL